MKHTPGPWRHVKTTQNSHEVWAPDDDLVCMMSHYSSKEVQGKASIDADLIAAAPEMLEALEYTRDHLIWQVVPESICGKVNRAIAKAKAKAKGEQP